MKTEAYDVVVVGAGPVGLVSALTLKKRGLSVAVIERDDRPGTHSYALALHERTQYLLSELGVSSGLWNQGYHVNRINFANETGVASTLTLQSDETHHDGLIVVGQDRLETYLVEALDREGVAVKWSNRLAGMEETADGIELDVESMVEGLSGYASARLEWQVDKAYRIRAKYVVGADGHFSYVRRWMKIPFEKVARVSSFAVFEFRTDLDLDHAATVVMTEGGDSMMWPLPGGYCRWAFEVEDGDGSRGHDRDKDRLFVQIGSSGYRVLESSQLTAFLSKRAPWFTGSIGSMRWRMIVHFEKRLVESFGRGRIWLAGDAAHLAAPVGMQSMNIGMLESHELGLTLSRILSGHETSEEALNAYNEDRLDEWRSLLGLSTQLVPAAGAVGPVSQFPDRVLGCLPCGRDRLASLAGSLNLEVASISGVTNS